MTKKVPACLLTRPLFPLLGCGDYMNQSFGQIHIDDHRGSSYVRCNWEIGSVGISQAVAFVWIQDLYFYYSL